MVSIDPDKLIRDKARELAAAVVKHADWHAQGKPRPDLHSLGILDVVIEELVRERDNRMNRPLPHKVECSTCSGSGKVLSLSRHEPVACAACEGTGKIIAWRTPTNSQVVPLRIPSTPTARRATPADVLDVIERWRGWR